MAVPGFLYHGATSFMAYTAATYGFGSMFNMINSDDDESRELWISLSISVGVVCLLVQSIKLCKDIPREKVNDYILDSAYAAFFSPIKAVREQFFNGQKKDDDNDRLHFEVS